MTKQDLKNLIKEEIRKVLSEAPSMSAKKKAPIKVSSAAKKASVAKKSADAKMAASDAARAKALAPIPGSGRPYDCPTFRKLNAMRPKPGYEVDGGPKTEEMLKKLIQKHGLKYAAGCFEAAVDLTYTGYYASQAYDGKFKNDSYEFEKDVTDLSNIHSREWASEDSFVYENKNTVNEGPEVTSDRDLLSYINSIKPSGAIVKKSKYVKGPGEDGMATTIQLGPDKTMDPTLAFGVENGNPVLIFAYGPTSQIKSLGKLLRVSKIDKTGDPKNDTSRIDYSATNARPFPVVKDIKKVFSLMKKTQ